jgi:hypothetical protein
MIFLRDGYELTIEAGSIGDVAAKGSAILVFIDGTGADLPAVGDKLLSPDGYCAVAPEEGEPEGEPADPATTYDNIRCVSIKQVPYHVTGGVTGYRYECLFSSDAGDPSEWRNFRTDLDVASVEDPVRWRLAAAVDPESDTDYPTGALGVQGDMEGKISRRVVVGSFDLVKTVHQDKINDFWSDYIAIAGKLNQVTMFVYGESSSNSFEFPRGQVLCGSIAEATDNKALYRFAVTFTFRRIGDITATGASILRDDWNFALVPTSNTAGWMLPVQLSTASSDSTTLSSAPFLYDYADFSTFIDADYSIADEEPPPEEP